MVVSNYAACPAGSLKAAHAFISIQYLYAPSCIHKASTYSTELVPTYPVQPVSASMLLNIRYPNMKRVNDPGGRETLAMVLWSDVLMARPEIMVYPTVIHNGRVRCSP